MAGHTQPRDLVEADGVLLLARLGLAMYLAGLNAVEGVWPELHCNQAHWRALLTFVAWRVLDARALAPYTKRAKFHDAWRLLLWREGRQERPGCLLPPRRKRLSAQSRRARLPKTPSPAARAAQQPKAKGMQKERDAAFWLSRVNCWRGKDERWVLFFRLTPAHTARAETARKRFSVPLGYDWAAEVATAATFSVHLHRLVCWWLGACESADADVLEDRLHACHRCYKQPGCLSQHHLRWDTATANAQQALQEKGAHKQCYSDRGRKASAASHAGPRGTSWTPSHRD